MPWLVCKDCVSYQNGNEADQKGNKEDPNAIEMHHTANRATQGLRLVGWHGYFRVHQETSVGEKEQPELLPWLISSGAVSEMCEAYPCFWLKFW